MRIPIKVYERVPVISNWTYHWLMGNSDKIEWLDGSLYVVTMSE
jgi:hypothetical protein